jgi:uncharacterized protein (TIRG00374 family)
LKKNFFQIVKIFFFLFIGFFSIWWFLNKLSPSEKQEIWKAITQANYWWLVISMVIGAFAHYIRALRWNLIIQPIGFNSPIKSTFSAVAVGYLGNFLMPRFGEFARCITLKKQVGVPFSSALGTVIIERMFDMIVFVLIFIAGLFLFFKQLQEIASGYLYELLNTFFKNGNIILIALIIFVMMITIIYFFRVKLQKKRLFLFLYTNVKKFIIGLTAISKMRKWILFIFYSLLIWICYFFMTWICFFALPETSELSISAGLAILAFGTIGIIVVQGGIGVFPLIVAETLVLFGILTTTGYAMGWLIWLSQTITIIIIGLFAFAYLTFKKALTIEDIRKYSTQDIE